MLVQQLKSSPRGMGEKNSQGRGKAWLRAEDCEAVVRCVRPLLGTHDSLMRASTFRVLRHIVGEKGAVCAMHVLGIDLFIVRALEREARYVLERMEALKLVRRMAASSAYSNISVSMSASSTSHSMAALCAKAKVSEGVVRSLVALSLSAEDNFRCVALETLRDVLVRVDLAEMALRCGALKAVVQAVVDPRIQEMAQPLLLTLVHVLNHEHTRKHVRAALDLGPILSGVLQMTPSRHRNQEELNASKWKACSRACSGLLKSWSGLITLASSPHCLTAIIQTMVQPVPREVRKSILVMLLQTFRSILPARAASLPLQQQTAPAAKQRTTSATKARSTSGVDSRVYSASYWGLGPGSSGNVSI